MAQYREYPPHPALGRHLACLWTSDTPAADAGDPAAGAYRVLPDNCIDILWQDDGTAGFAVGMMSRPIDVTPGRRLRTVAARFKPGAAAPFLELPLHLLGDRRTDLERLWQRGEADRLSDRLWNAPDQRARLAILERHLLERLRRTNAPQPALVGRAVAALEQSGGLLRIDTMAGQLGVTRQHLAAQFRTRVGLSPKLFARICRFRRASAALKQRGNPDWAALALEWGYYDQSHLIHDFQEFAATTPEIFVGRG